MRAKDSPQKTPAKRRILIVDDQPLIRRGLASLIANEPDLMVCGEAATQNAGVDAIPSARPDLVITDVSFKDGASLAMVKAIRRRYKHVPVLVHSMHDAPIYAERAFQAGASGYVTKQETGDTVLIAIRRVLDGERYLSPKTENKLDHK